MSVNGNPPKNKEKLDAKLIVAPPIDKYVPIKEEIREKEYSPSYLWLWLLLL